MFLMMMHFGSHLFHNQRLIFAALLALGFAPAGTALNGHASDVADQACHDVAKHERTRKSGEKLLRPFRTAAAAVSQCAFHNNLEERLLHEKGAAPGREMAIATSMLLLLPSTNRGQNALTSHANWDCLRCCRCWLLQERIMRVVYELFRVRRAAAALLAGNIAPCMAVFPCWLGVSAPCSPSRRC